MFFKEVISREMRIRRKVLTKIAEEDVRHFY
nr:MAG TPA: hypothetical protein [Bacteriophage sp.]